LLAGLNNAAWAAALALIAAIGARIARRRPAVVHALWLLVLIKLATPSILQFTPPQRRDRSPVRSQPSDSPRTDAAVQPVAQRDAIVVDESVPRPILDENVKPAREPTLRVPATWPWRGSILVLWLAGAAACWSAVGLSSIRFRRLIRAARPAPAELV